MELEPISIFKIINVNSPILWAYFAVNPQPLVRSVFSRETGRVLVVGAPDIPVVDATATVEKLLCRFSSILQPSRVIYYKSHRRLTCDSSSNL